MSRRRRLCHAASHTTPPPTPISSHTPISPPTLTPPPTPSAPPPPPPRAPSRLTARARTQERQPGLTTTRTRAVLFMYPRLCVHSRLKCGSSGGGHELRSLFWSPRIATPICTTLAPHRWLVGRGAEVDRPNEWGDAPVNEAATMGHFGIVWYLADHGANLSRTQVESSLSVQHNIIQDNTVHYIIALRLLRRPRRQPLAHADLELYYYATSILYYRTLLTLLYY